MSPAAEKKGTRLVLGGIPRVHLLPPEVGDRKRSASIRRAAVVAVIGSVAVCALGFAYAGILAADAAAKYDDARAETSALLVEQGKYTELRTLAELQQTLTNARQVGAITEIDWQSFYTRVVPTLPDDITLSSFIFDAGSPIQDAPAATIPGSEPTVATITFVVRSGSLASTQAWIVALKTLPEYGGARVASISSDDSGLLTATVELKLTSAAFTNRYGPEPEPDPTSTDAPAETEG